MIALTPVVPNPNCTMLREHFDLPAVRAAAEAIQEAMRRVHAAGSSYCSWVGTLDEAHVPETIANKGSDYTPLSWAYDDKNIPWFTLWEYTWVLANSGLLASPPSRVLSLGGNACALDVAVGLAGHELVVVDRSVEGVRRAEQNAQLLGYRLTGRPGSLADLPRLLSGLEGTFDAAISTSVLFLCGAAAHAAVSRTLKNFLRSGGVAGFTFDVANPNPHHRYVKDPVQVFAYEGFTVVPAGCAFEDHGVRHHLYYPNPALGRYTAGALFLLRE